MWALYDTIQACKNKINTVGLGAVCSAAALILACGTGKRYATPNCSFMFHQGTTGVNETMNQRDAEERLEYDKKELNKYFETLELHTKKPAKYWKDKSYGELWLDPKGMIGHGVVDEIWQG
jgi:ATP-dependent Clp protease protease subunit